METPDTFSRIAKVLVDTVRMEPEAAAEKLAAHRVSIAYGEEATGSPTLQAAILTAANVADRCFPGGITIHQPAKSTPIQLPWQTAETLEAEIQSISDTLRITSAPVPSDERSVLVFGSRPDCDRGLQFTFNGWSAGVAPISERLRLSENEVCPLAGVLGGALAVSEDFMAVSGLSVEATRRTVGLSLWRPDLDWRPPEAEGRPPKYLPAEFWLLGLGHLGQAYAWCIGLLPFTEPDKVRIVLNDGDCTVPANLGTGMLSSARNIGELKTRVVAHWLERRGFKPRLIERWFDEHTRRQDEEPALALCGFDGKGPRRLLDRVGFEYVVECGLGGRADNFDAMDLHTLPSALGRTAEQIWSGGDGLSQRQWAERLSQENPVYREIADRTGCGHVELAHVSASVPFVGASAASLVVAEALRALNGGQRYESMTYRLGYPTIPTGTLVASDNKMPRTPRIGYQRGMPIRSRTN